MKEKSKNLRVICNATGIVMAVIAVILDIVLQLRNEGMLSIRDGIAAVIAYGNFLAGTIFTVVFAIKLGAQLARKDVHYVVSFTQISLGFYMMNKAVISLSDIFI